MILTPCGFVAMGCPHPDTVLPSHDSLQYWQMANALECKAVHRCSNKIFQNMQAQRPGVPGAQPKPDCIKYACVVMVPVTDTSGIVLEGERCIEAGRFDEALDLFERALALKPDDPDLWNLKGVALRGIGRYEESARCFERSLRIDPRDRHSS